MVRNARQSTTSASSPARSPRGREQIREAVLDAAAHLFSERGYSGVSIRDIAERSGINHALVHRHFGTKQDLLGVVLETLADDMAQATSTSIASDDTEATMALFDEAAGSQYWRILARAILDGQLPEQLQRQFTNVNRLVEIYRAALAEGRVDEELDPNVLAAMTAAMGLGWMLFEPFLFPAAGLNDRKREDVHAAYRTHARFLQEALAARVIKPK